VTKPNREDSVPETFIEWLGIRHDHSLYTYRKAGIVIATVLELFLAVALVFAMIAAIAVMYGTTRDVVNEVGTGPNLGAGALIAALLGAPFLIWSTILKHREVEFQKEGHLTDRISAAVEQLGAEKTVKKDGGETSEPNIEVRIGAILSLERIAQDSTKYDKGRDHVRVMEILCAYIRQNAPATQAKDHDFGEWLTFDEWEEKHPEKPKADLRAEYAAARDLRFGPNRNSEGPVYNWAQTLPKPRADIAIALRVIGRRNAKQRQAEAQWGKDAKTSDLWVFDTERCPSLPDGDGQKTKAELDAFKDELEAWRAKIDAYRGYRLDLRDTCLQRADLSDLCLSGAWLEGARLEGADLNEARLEGANLGRARMEGANLSAARMEGAHLSFARLERANLVRARMLGASLLRTQMEGADLTEAKLAFAFMVQAKLMCAFLHDTQMHVANLIRARLDEARLISTKLKGANLALAELVGADLFWLDSVEALLEANTQNAASQHCDFSDINAAMGKFTTMFGDATVTLPNGITPSHPDWPAHWPKTKLKARSFTEAHKAWLSTQP
jgi:uncharacterized protein YjbI with pentapeptide repeats